ncbi:MAG: hypothetical protein K0R75_322 [Paenibacillaceae bacterium]|nr:hypothetical protein [Paenibacillaceae bacterium]
MITTRVILDTNILVYAWDSEQRMKQEIAISTMNEFRENICLTTQILAEFSSVMLKLGASPDWIRETIAIYEGMMTILPLSPSHIKEALRAVDRYRMSYWDAQIWSVAKANHIPVVYTEDGPIGQTLEGVRYNNPFT